MELDNLSDEKSQSVYIHRKRNGVRRSLWKAIPGHEHLQAGEIMAHKLPNVMIPLDSFRDFTESYPAMARVRRHLDTICADWHRRTLISQCQRQQF